MLIKKAVHNVPHRSHPILHHNVLLFPILTILLIILRSVLLLLLLPLHHHYTTTRNAELHPNQLECRMPCGERRVSKSEGRRRQLSSDSVTAISQAARADGHCHIVVVSDGRGDSSRHRALGWGRVMPRSGPELQQKLHLGSRTFEEIPRLTADDTATKRLE